MSTNLNPLAIRHRLGREQWAAPQPFGPDGWSFGRLDDSGSVIVSCAPHAQGLPGEFVHASIAWALSLPTYQHLTELAAAVWPDGFCYQQFVPPRLHVNLHPNALHLWGRLDGKPVLPFGEGTV